MPMIESFTHNGISILRQPAPAPYGPLGSVVLGLVGTAPDADPAIPRSKAYRIANPAQAAKLDMTGNERGTLYRAVNEILKMVDVPIWVVIEEEDTATVPAPKDYTMAVSSATSAELGLRVVVTDSTLVEAVVGAQAASWTVEVGGKSAQLVSFVPGEENVLTIKAGGAIALGDLTQGALITVHGKDLTAAGTIANIVGRIDPATGRRTGIQALAADVKETLTDIAAPGFSHKAVHDALSVMGRRLFCRVALEGPSSTDDAAIALSESLAVTDTGYDQAVIVDPFVKVWSNAAKGYVYMSGVAHYLSCVGRVQPWEAPGRGRMGVLIEGTQRSIDYNIIDKASRGNLLNKYGVAYFARTSLGGYSLIGNRTVSGRFLSVVGLELAIIRKLKATSERDMAHNLTEEFMQQKVGALQEWLDSQASAGAMIGAKVYLHPTLNNADNYMNGEWHIVITYGAYRPNEHMVYHLREDVGIVKAWLEEVL